MLAELRGGRSGDVGWHRFLPKRGTTASQTTVGFGCFSEARRAKNTPIRYKTCIVCVSCMCSTAVLGERKTGGRIKSVRKTNRHQQTPNELTPYYWISEHVALSHAGDVSGPLLMRRRLSVPCFLSCAYGDLPAGTAGSASQPPEPHLSLGAPRPPAQHLAVSMRATSPKIMGGGRGGAC